MTTINPVTNGVGLTDLLRLLGRYRVSEEAIPHEYQENGSEPTKWYNYIQCYREVIDTEGVNHDSYDTYLNFKSAVDCNFLFGRSNEVTSLDKESKWQTSSGIDEITTTFGTVITSGKPNKCTTEDWKKITEAIITKKAPRDYLILAQKEAHEVILNYLKSLTAPDDKVLKEVVLQDYDKKPVNVMCHRFSWGALHYQLIKLADTPPYYPELIHAAYFVPIGKVKTKNGHLPRLSARFTKHNISDSNNLGDNIWASWCHGRYYKDPTTGERLQLRTNFLTYQSIEAIGADMFIKLSFKNPPNDDNQPKDQSTESIQERSQTSNN